MNPTETNEIGIPKLPLPPVDGVIYVSPHPGESLEVVPGPIPHKKPIVTVGRHLENYPWIGSPEPPYKPGTVFLLNYPAGDSVAKQAAHENAKQLEYRGYVALVAAREPGGPWASLEIARP